MAETSYAGAWRRYKRAEAEADKRRALMFAALRRAHERGATWAEIATEIGVSRSRVGQLLAQAEAHAARGGAPR